MLTSYINTRFGDACGNRTRVAGETVRYPGRWMKASFLLWRNVPGLNRRHPRGRRTCYHLHQRSMWWSLWDSNPSVVLFAEQASTPSRPKPHIELSQVRLEPTMFLTSRIYSPVFWPLDEGAIFVMEERTGLEPASSAWRADILAFFSGCLSRAEPLRGSYLGSGSESKSI